MKSKRTKIPKPNSAVQPVAASVLGNGHEYSTGHTVNAQSISPFIQRSIKEHEGVIQRKGKGKAEVSASVESGIKSSKGSGVNLDARTNQFMSSKFGTDFSNVKIHNNSRAHHLAENIHAKAFTIGDNVYFNRGEYNPNSIEGKRLLAHELTHTLQQKNGLAIQRKKSKAYTFTGCSQAQHQIIDRNIRQAYAIIDYAIRQLITATGLIGTLKDKSQYGVGLIGILDSALHDFGANDLSTLGDIKMNLILMKHKLLSGLNINCHNDPNRNQIAEATVGGKDIWFGPSFFDKKYTTNDLISRPRIIVHELAHNIGLDHVFQGIAFNAKTGQTSTAQVAHGADSYAMFTYRLYTGRYRGKFKRMKGI